jgi:hypothetical protein
MNKNILIHSDASLHHHFYDTHLIQYTHNLASFLGPDHQIHLFPEATIKKNLTPNGILIKSKKDKTLFMPAILRDPGCGFLLFKIKNLNDEITAELCQSILNFCQSIETESTNTNTNLHDAIKHGVSHLPIGQSVFSDSCFSLNADYQALDTEEAALHDDLTSITNTLEIYKVDNNDSLIGFIHSGSTFFPRAIHDYWYQYAANHTFTQSMATLNEISQGMYCIPSSSDEGRKYKQHLHAAMNYCIYKRWYLFNKLKKLIKKNYNLQTDIINDRCHAGLFEIQNNNKTYYAQSRGVQIIKKNHDNNVLVAGQKESASCLYTNLNRSFIGHGTSYAINNNIDYCRETPSQLNISIDNMLSNTTINDELTLPYTYNIYKQHEFYMNPETTCDVLYPVLNYHGKYLRGLIREQQH